MLKHKLPRRFSAARVSLLIVMLVTMTGQRKPPVDYDVTTPRNFLGYDIGQDYKLTPYQTHELKGEGVRQGIVEYMHELERTSERVHVIEYGKTELGKPMILTIVTSEENWAQINNLKGILRKLADPRQVASDEEARFLAEQGRRSTGSAPPSLDRAYQP